jgi:hypothetical protein
MVITSFQIDFLIVASKNKNIKAKTHQNYKHTRNYDPQREQNTLAKHKAPQHLKPVPIEKKSRPTTKEKFKKK